MNKIILLGRLTKDPEIRYTQSSDPLAITRYRLAVNRRFHRQGEPDADFINCVAFGKTGEFADKYFRKGQLVCVSGRLQISDYEKNGVRQWFAEVIIEEQDFAESKASAAAHGADFSEPGSDRQSAQKPAPEPQNDEFFAIDANLDDDDLPF